jgi:hypothetical protein
MLRLFQPLERRTCFSAPSFPAPVPDTAVKELTIDMRGSNLEPTPGIPASAPDPIRLVPLAHSDSQLLLRPDA